MKDSFVQHNISLPNSLLFKGLSQESISYLTDGALVQSVPAGKFLVHQGDSPEYVFVVLEGAIRTLRTDEKGNEATLRLLIPGETCMEAVAFMEIPSPISVQTVSSSKVISIPCDKIKVLANENTVFANNLLHILSYHYKNALYQIDGMNIKSPFHRVGFYFLVRFLERGNGQLKIQLPFKKSIIANYLGMTAETFSRALHKLKAIGVDVKDDAIKLNDPHALCIFCDSDTENLCKTGKRRGNECPREAPKPQKTKT